MCDEISICVADLAAYNNSILHGVWIDATEDLEVINEQINTMLASSPVEDAEEYVIHNYERFVGYPVSEYEGIQRVHEIACFIEEHGTLEGELLSYECGDVNSAARIIEECYAGYFQSLEAFAQDLIESTRVIPADFEMYIDYEKMGRDFEYTGSVFTIKTAYDKVHVFWSR